MKNAPQIIITTLSLLATFASNAAAQSVVYRETFKNNSGANATIATVGWQFWIDGGVNQIRQITGTSNSLLSALPGRLTTLPEISLNGIGASDANGFAVIFSLGEGENPLVFFTREYPVVAINNLTEISFYQGNASDSSLRVVLEIGEGNWYVSSQDNVMASPVTVGGNFTSDGVSPNPAGAVLKTVTLAGSTWNTLNFANGAPITVGAPITLPTSGSITGFGLFANSPSDTVRIDNFQLNAVVPGGPAVTTILPLGTQLLDETGLDSGIAWRAPTVIKFFDIDGDNILGTAGYYLAKTTWGPGNFESYVDSSFDTSVMTFSDATWLVVTASADAVNSQINYGYRTFQNPNDTTAKLSVGFMGRGYSTNTITGEYYSLFNFTVGSGLPGNFSITVATHPEIPDPRNASALRLTQIAGSGSGSATIAINQSSFSDFNAAFSTFRIIGAKAGDVFQLLGQARNTSANGNVLINALMIDSITSVPVLTPYQTWQTTAFPGGTPAADMLLTADPDADGLNNLLEYALGGLPTNASSAPLPSVGTSGNFLTLTFTRARSDLTYVVEGSNSLTGTWTTVATNPGLVSTITPVTVTDAESLTIQPRRFLRLNITSP